MIQLLFSFFSVCVPVLVFFLWVTPYTQGFFCDDRSLQYPYRPDTISTPILMIAGLGIPISMVGNLEMSITMVRWLAILDTGI